MQWVKNVFVFMPLFFNGSMLDGAKVVDALWVFAAFCLISSSVYSINDARDAELDRRHPVKRHRPIASGKITPIQGYLIAAVLAASAVPVCLLSNIYHPAEVLGIICAYMLMNLAYCFGAKRIAVLDVVILSLGYVLRVCAGGVGTDIRLSVWIIVMTFLLALFLALAKRRDDVAIYATTGEKMRPNIDRYSITALDRVIRAVGGITFACYLLYTVSEEVMIRFQSHYVYITAIFVLLGLLRYIRLTIRHNCGGSPTRALMHDYLLQLDIALWLLSFAAIIYW